MISLLADIVERFQWSSVRKEIGRLAPKTIALVKRMEYDLMAAVNQIGNEAIGVNVLYIDPKDGKVLVSLSELKTIMEQCARKSLGLVCSKKFKRDFSDIPLDDWVLKLETLCVEMLSERETDACVPYPLITRSPSFFITGNTMMDPWFLFVPGRKIPRMVGA